MISHTDRWTEKYSLACKYYKHYKNLNIPFKFKTFDGINYDDNGIPLGIWIYDQREKYKSRKLSNERIKRLNKIGMRFDNINSMNEWMKSYKIALDYFKKNGNMEFRGKNMNEEEALIKDWIDKQRLKYRRGSLSEKQFILLRKIMVRFDKLTSLDIWMNSYNKVLDYYQTYGDLKIHCIRKEYNSMMTWIYNQRVAYNEGKLSNKQIKLLNDIGISYNIKNFDEEWTKKYNLAKNYYEYYGNLNIPQKFSTNDGINYNKDGIKIGAWLSTQKQAYRGNLKSSLNSEKIKLLEDIGIIWINDKTSKKLNSEIIDSSNSNRKKVEILNMFKSYLLEYKEDTLPPKEELNTKILKKLK